MNHQAMQHCLCFPHSRLSFFSSFYWQHGLLKTDSDAEWLAHFFMTCRKYSFRNRNMPSSKIHTEGEKLGTKIIENNHRQDFPSGGPGLKNPPASAGDMGSIPGPGRFHRPLGSQACVLQLLTSHALELRCCNQRVAPACCQQRKPTRSSEDSAQSKMDKQNILKRKEKQFIH